MKLVTPGMLIRTSDSQVLYEVLSVMAKTPLGKATE